MVPTCDSKDSVIPAAGVIRRGIATGLDLLVWFTIAWFTWTADISILFGATTSKWRALAELVGINLLMPGYLSLEIFTGATIGKWAVGLAVSSSRQSRAPWILRLLRWSLKSSPWLLMTTDIALAIVFEREVMPAILQRMTEQLGYAGEWFMGLLDHLPIGDRGTWLLMVPFVAFSRFQIGALLLVPLVAGESLMLLPSRRTLIDRLTSTRITRRHSTNTGHGFEVVVGKDHKSK